MSNKEVKYVIRAKNDTKSGIDDAKKDLHGIIPGAEGVQKALTNAFKIGAIAVATKEIAQFGKQCFDAAIEAERIGLKLKGAFGGDDLATDRMNSFISEFSKKTLEVDDDIQNVIGSIKALGRSESEIQKIVEASNAWAQVTGGTLESSWTMVNDTLNGATGKIGKLIPEIETLTEKQLANGDGLDLMLKKLNPLVEAMGDSTAQKVKNLSESFENLKESIGGGIATMMSPVIEWVTKLIDTWTGAIEEQKKYIEVTKKNKDALTKEDEAVLLRHKTKDLQKTIELKLKQGGFDLKTADVRSADFQAIYNNLPEVQELNTALTQLVAVENEILKLQNDLMAKDGYYSDKPTSLLLEEKGGESNYKKLPKQDKGFISDLFEDLREPIQHLDSYDAEFRLTETLIDALDTISPDIYNDEFSGGEQIIGSAKFTTPMEDAFTGFKDIIGTSLGGLDADGLFGGLLSAVKPLIDALGPLTDIIFSANPVFAILIKVVEGVAQVLGPAIGNILQPVFTALNSIGQTIGKMLLPIIDSLAPIFAIVAEIVMKALYPAIALLAPIVGVVAGILDVTLTPLLKGVAIAFEVLSSPLRFLGDLFMWVGKVIQDFVYNLDPFKADRNTAGNFSSDAFSGLGDRIKAIAENTYRGNNAGSITDIETSYKTGMDVGYAPSPGNPASYSGNTININYYQQAPIYGDAGIEQATLDVFEKAAELNLFARM